MDLLDFLEKRYGHVLMNKELNALIGECSWYSEQIYKNVVSQTVDSCKKAKELSIIKEAL